MATTTTFGKDVSCTDSLRTGRYATGVRLVAEAYYRRLTTPRGMLRGGEDEANYGLDLTAEVGKNSVTAALPTRIANELSKDPRTESVDVDIVESKTADGVGIKLLITIYARTAEGPFSLQIGVSSVSAELLGIVTEAA